jgi:hypothetical protein
LYTVLLELFHKPCQWKLQFVEGILFSYIVCVYQQIQKQRWEQPSCWQGHHIRMVSSRLPYK